ncbi:hypothetical protein E2C01_091032 [Portunus trituberculatus]|uniref:Uncharacterized protein n=1 Tax=Portunus trituberculatus TaxID=210409 RepID=A0A5B7JMG5_PORTR|nr:hypothetical protein [Portunus trituberculatus]
MYKEVTTDSFTFPAFKGTYIYCSPPTPLATASLPPSSCSSYSHEPLPPTPHPRLPINLAAASPHNEHLSFTCSINT